MSREPIGRSRREEDPRWSGGSRNPKGRPSGRHSLARTVWPDKGSQQRIWCCSRRNVSPKWEKGNAVLRRGQRPSKPRKSRRVATHVAGQVVTLSIAVC